MERQYLGITITAQNYKEILEKEGRDGINYHTKHLRAYLKGKTNFKHKWMRDGEGRVITDPWGNPRWNIYPVQQQSVQPRTINADDTGKSGS